MCCRRSSTSASPATTATFTADYALFIKRNTCSSKAEACILQPGQAQSATLTNAASPFGFQNEAWFAFDVTGTADSGVDQTVTLTADGLPDPGNFKATLEDFSTPAAFPPPAWWRTAGRRTFEGPDGRGVDRVPGDPAGGADRGGRACDRRGWTRASGSSTC